MMCSIHIDESTTCVICCMTVTSSVYLPLKSWAVCLTVWTTSARCTVLEMMHLTGSAWTKMAPITVAVWRFTYLLPHETNRNRNPCLNCRNWTVQFQKPNTPVLFRLVTVRAPSGYDDVLLLQPSGVWTMERRESRQLWRLKWRLIDLIDEKEKETRKLGQKYENKRFNWLCWRYITISRDLYLYRQQNVALWVKYDQIFSKQTKSQILLELYLFWKNWMVRFLWLWLLAWFSSILIPWCLLNPFLASKHLGSSNLRI
jgi:hypothetical protein